ncbi:hypothetical protein [Pseudonocardia sp.]|nr:hypothetical protein [Pseudonocardia sp.]
MFRVVTYPEAAEQLAALPVQQPRRRGAALLFGPLGMAQVLR